MALFKLNVYGANDEIIKSYATSKLKYGLIEDFVCLAKDLDNKPQLEQFQLMKPIIKNLFMGITDEELRNVDVIEVVQVITSLFNEVSEGFGVEEKN